MKHMLIEMICRLVKKGIKGERERFYGGAKKTASQVEFGSIGGPKTKKIAYNSSSTDSTRHMVCVCVFFPSILDIKFVGCTSRGHTGGRSHRIFNPPSFCGACLDFCREKDSAFPFPRRP